MRMHWEFMAWKNLKKVKIFGSGTNRSARAIWTANELDLEYELVTSDVLAKSLELRSLHPQHKIPSALIDDLEIFESSAICEYLCDSLPGNNLLAASGSRERVIHSQWVSFSQSEIEAYLWHNFLLKRSGKGLESFQESLEINHHMALEGLRVLNEHLERSEYLCGVHFSLADIIVGWTINWARRSSLISSFGHLNNDLDRLFERSHCVLAR